MMMIDLLQILTATKTEFCKLKEWILKLKEIKLKEWTQKMKE